MIAERPVASKRRLLPAMLTLALIGGACREEPRRPAAPTTTAAPAVPSAPAAPAATTTAAPAAPGTRSARGEELERAQRTLEALIRAGASDPTNPWALAHGLLAFGPELKTSDGRLAIEVMVGDFAEQRTVDGRKLLVFPPRSAAGRPVEPHPDLIVKSLLEVEVPLSRRFPLKDGATVTLERLVEDAAWKFEEPTDDAAWRRFAWSDSAWLDALADDGRVRTQRGELELDALNARALAQLEKEQAFLEGPAASGRPDLVEKRKQGIFAHTCGGMHFIQAVTKWASRKQEPALRARVLHQLELLLFRWEAERRIYRRMIEQEPRYKVLLEIQQLKFYGHTLETLGLAARWGLRLDASAEPQVRALAADLLDTVRALEPTYGRAAQLFASSPQSYYDLIGDGCHAVRGLREARLAFFRE
jgi:hypothetical protein